MTARVRDLGHCMSGPKPHPMEGVKVEAVGFKPSLAMDESGPVYANWLARQGATQDPESMVADSDLSSHPGHMRGGVPDRASTVSSAAVAASSSSPGSKGLPSWRTTTHIPLR